jgi:broad specificity phosphatase PhoE
MRKLLLVRHAETILNAQGRLIGRLDIPLSRRGKKQAAILAKKLRDEHPELLFSSPLKRAKQTAALIEKFCALKATFLEEFREINFGCWEGKTFLQIEKEYPQIFHKWLENPEGIDIPAGEPWSCFKNRVWEGFNRIIQTKAECIVIVSHGGPLKLILARFLGYPKVNFSKIRIDHGSITTLYVRRGKITIAEINALSHLSSLK